MSRCTLSIWCNLYVYFYLLLASDTINLSQKQRKILTRVCKKGGKKIGSYLLVTVFSKWWVFFILYMCHSICDVLCELCGYTARGVLDLGPDGTGILQHRLVLCIHVLIILELLGHFNDRDGMKLCFNSSFSHFSPFLSLSFWIPLVNWICRRGDKAIQCVWWVQTAQQ